MERSQPARKQIGGNMRPNQLGTRKDRKSSTINKKKKYLSLSPPTNEIMSWIHTQQKHILFFDGA